MFKPFSLFALIFVLNITAFSQTNPKSKAKEKPPTQKEVDQMMKEIEQLMNDPETKKAMEEQGVKMPDLKALPKFTDKEYADAELESQRKVPAKDVKRIAAISKQPLSDAALKSHLTATHAKVQQAMRPALLSWIKSKSDSMSIQYGSGATLAQIALNCYIIGLYETAVFLMGKVVLANPADPTHLNNYAAMLNTGGGEHLALPILQTLNAKYRGDYTIVNNIGQAWYGLGDLQMAGKYIDSAIRLYPRNPQALHTKSKIEAEKGNKEAAKKALKQSLEEAFTEQKEYELRQLITASDEQPQVRWTMNAPKDAFGLGNFIAPPFPMSIEESKVLEPQWESFKEKCKALLDELESRKTVAEEEAGTAMEKRQKEVFGGKSSFPVPWLAPKAAYKLRMLKERNRKNTNYSFYEAEEKFLTIDAELDDIKDLFSNKEEAIENKYAPLFGEGKQNPFAAHCAEINKVRNDFLAKANTLVHDRYMAYITQLKVMINEEAEYSLYAHFKEDYEIIKLHLQQKFLTALISPPVQFKQPAGTCPKPNMQPVSNAATLANFYDRNCAYVSEFYVPLIGKWTQRCDIMTVELFTKIPLGPASVSLGGKYVINSDTKQENGTVEIGVGVGIGDKKIIGVTNTGVKAEVKTVLHLTNRGITDIELGGGVGIKTGFGGDKGSTSSNLSPIIKGSITHAGIEGKYSIMNGAKPSGGVKFMDFKL
jgi:tetratricopeptide (TPR) repeat protein